MAEVIVFIFYTRADEFVQSGEELKENIMIKRASIFVFSFLVLLTLISFGVLLAQEKFQTKPITIFVPYGSGGSTDITTRALSEAGGKLLGQPIIVQNKPAGVNAADLGPCSGAYDGIRLVPLANPV
jgi:hypothetical protein